MDMLVTYQHACELWKNLGIKLLENKSYPQCVVSWGQYCLQILDRVLDRGLGKLLKNLDISRSYTI